MSSYRINTALPSSTSVGRSHFDSQATVDTSAKAKTKAVNLFDLTSLPVQQQQVTSTDGSALSLPSLSTEDVQNVQNLFGNIDPSQQTSINAAGQQLGSALFDMLKNSASKPVSIDTSGDDDDDGSFKPMTTDFTSAIKSATAMSPTALASAVAATSTASASASSTTDASSAGIKVPSHAKLSTTGASSPYVGVNEAAPSSVAAATTAASNSYAAANPNASYDNQVQAVTYMGVTNLQNQMTTFAQGVAAKQKAQSAISADASELNTAVAEWPANVSTQSFTLHQTDSLGNVTTVTKDLTKEQATAAATSAESTASSMQDESQTDLLKLQNMSQTYSNAISTISNLMKVSYDTVKNTVGNIHY